MIASTPDRPLRIAHLPTLVGGQAPGLAEGERTLGHEATVIWSSGDNPYRYPCDLALDDAGRPAADRLKARWDLAARLRGAVDVVHFNFGRSLVHFPEADLVLEDVPHYGPRVRKVFTFQGCDARQKYPTMARRARATPPVAACFADDCYGGMCNSGEKDRERRTAIEKAALFADHMFALNPDLMRFLPADRTSFLPYAVPGFDAIAPRREPFFADDTVHVVHAPSQRAIKGSGAILAALERLRDELGARLKVTVVEGVPNAEARAIYRTADVVVDQVLLGWYGGLAVEVMKMGIPVVCHIQDEDLALVPQALAAELPVIRAHPDTLYGVLRGLLAERERLPEAGARSRAFVER